jgi:hypothetical protein
VTTFSRSAAWSGLVCAGLVFSALAAARTTLPRQRSGEPAAAAAGDVDDPADTFTPQPMTRWMAPKLLLQSAAQVVVSGVLGQYNDKREMMAALRDDGIFDYSDRSELWFDYVSDPGDGFDSTYAVAKTLSARELVLPGRDGQPVVTPRGSFVVMGGDEVYPSASVQEYEDRFIGPYRAALPRAAGERTDMFVIPGNHDWYDGLTAFMRTFCQQRGFGGWQTRQSRSYFAMKLPSRWWLWGIDIQFDTYIDDAQLGYLRRAAQQLQPGDAVILCTAKPSWVAVGNGDVEAYANLDFLHRTLIEPTGAGVRVHLTGDHHHYLRYSSADGAQKITAGGGGAYLSSTHRTPERVSVPPSESQARGKSAPREYRRESAFPDAATSRGLVGGVVRLPWTTPSFTALMGGVQGALSLSLAATLTPPAHGLPAQLRGMAETLRTARVSELAPALAGSLSGLALSAAVVGGAVAFTREPRNPTALAAGLAHGAVQLGIGVASTAVAGRLCRSVPGGWLVAAVLPTVAVNGGFLAAEAVAGYLWVADKLGLNTNEVFAAQSIDGWKNWLRLHVDRDGDLIIYPVGLEQVPQEWEKASPSETWTPSEESRLVPVSGRLEPALIESPVRVTAQPLVG